MLGTSHGVETVSHGYAKYPVASTFRDAPADGFERGTIRRVEAKEHVFCEGDPRTHVFRIEEGAIALSKLLGDGRRQIIDFAYPGDYIGLGVLREHIFDAQATCATKVRCMSAAALERDAAKDASLALKLYKAVSAELAAARSLLVSVGQRTAMERVATFLRDLCERNEQADDAAASVVKLSMRRSDIADLLGLTIETVSRTITKLRTMRIIKVVHGTEVHVLDRDRLEGLAG